MERHPEISGAVNFRDFGGYETEDGRHVKWRKLFRCGHLAKLDDAAHPQLAALDLGLVCDFRSHFEAEKLVSRLPPDLAQRSMRLNIWPKSSRTMGEMIRGLRDGTYADADITGGLKVIYQEFVTDYAPQFAQLFSRIVAANGKGVLIHCTAGKDRTGIGAAMLLSALGVSQQTIMEDYLVTNSCQILRAEILASVRRFHAVEPHEEDRFTDILGAREDALRAALEAMIAVSGSVEGYLRDALGIDAETRAKMRGWYVE